MKTPERLWIESEPEIELCFEFSPTLLLVCIFLYGLVLALLLSLGPQLVWPGLLLLTGSLARCGRLPGLGWSRRSLLRASAHADGSWTLLEKSGRAVAAQLHGGEVYGTGLVFVCWETPIGRRRVVLVPDLADADALRRLRALLLTAGRS